MTKEERVDWLCRLRCWVVPQPMTVEQKSNFLKALTETIESLQTECEDAISREKVKEILKQLRDGSLDGFYVEKDILDLPSVTPKPKTGHWIDHQEDKWIYDQCSECGTVHDVRTFYCPHCGAEMEMNK